MKIKFLLLLLFSCLLFARMYANGFSDASNPDTTQIIKINKQAYNSRLTDPSGTVDQAKKGLAMAIKINYTNGIGEAYRVLGLGYYYLTQQETSLDCYLNALKYFQSNHNLSGLAKVNNNIGTLYRESDYDIAIDYYFKALSIAEKIKDEDLIATIDLNFGNIYYRKKNFTKALAYYDKSNALFTKLNNTVNLIQCLQNRGVIYYYLNQMSKAQELLLEANRQAKIMDLNTAVASINLTLTSLFIAQNKFDIAEMYLNEGLAFARQVKSTKLEYDYKLTRYELEFKRKDYKNALFSLRDIYKQDSATYKNNISVRLNLIDEQHKHREKEQENERIIERQKYDRQMFWASALVAGLFLVVIVLLVYNVNRKAKTNKRLTELNAKIFEQKENLNQINHHLEEIIDERTKDLQVKNKKLADYSLHLSHQIRGPIATLKGLLNLEKDDLIGPEECIKLMNKCVSEIDDNIIDMSGMLHESAKNN